MRLNAHMSFPALPQSWDAYFRQTAKGAPPGQAYMAPPTLRMGSMVPASIPAHAVEQGMPVDEKTIEDHLSVQSIIRSYQVPDKASSIQYYIYFH